MRGLYLANPFAIAGTGRRHRRYRWIRCPRNIAVKRGLIAAVGDLRGVTVPPSNYDDIARHCERSWKRHRTTRWRDRKDYSHA